MEEMIGNFVGICDGTVHISPLFFADMYPAGNGAIAYFLMSHVSSVQDLKAAVRYFDKHVDLRFREEDNIDDWFLKLQSTVLNFSNGYIRYYPAYFSYIKNLGLSLEKIVDENGKTVEIRPGEIQIWCSGSKIEVDDEVLALGIFDRELLNLSTEKF